MPEELKIKQKTDCRWDLVSLGEVMLRLDPGDGRVATTRTFQVWEGGGEYNVARGLKRCFGMDTAIVSALADNPVGRLVRIWLSGRVDQSHIRWINTTALVASRVAVEFTERGFGARAALGCSDRGHTAISQLQPGDIDWEEIFGKEKARWFHTGGIFCALSESTPAVAREAIEAARQHGAIVSYDLNYRESLWKSIGGKQRAQQVNRELAPLIDVILGNEEDFTACLGLEVEGLDEDHSKLNVENFHRMIERAIADFPTSKSSPPP
jgi:2-dehydro-3-deoxygluconokinase